MKTLFLWILLGFALIACKEESPKIPKQDDKNPIFVGTVPKNQPVDTLLSAAAPCTVKADSLTTFRNEAVLYYIKDNPDACTSIYITDRYSYTPDHVPKEFQVTEGHGLNVIITYQKTNITKFCGFGGNRPVIKLLCIEKKKK